MELADAARTLHISLNALLLRWRRGKHGATLVHEKNLEYIVVSGDEDDGIKNDNRRGVGRRPRPM